MLLALLADFADQALRTDEIHRSRNQEGLNPHVEHPVDAGRGIVGVQSTENQVTGQSRFYRDFRSLQVANLTDHDDVRILPKKGAKSCSESQSYLFLGLDLVDPVEVVLDGSSAVMMLTSSVFNLLSTVYSELVLPLPVGPVTRIIP